MEAVRGLSRGISRFFYRYALIKHGQVFLELQYHAVLERLISHERPIAFKQTEITTLRLPLQLTAATQVDSKQSPAVQLADVLVGAAMEAANAIGSPEGNASAFEVIGQYADHQLIHILPSRDLQEEKRFRQGGQGRELIEYFAANFAK